MPMTITLPDDLAELVTRRTAADAFESADAMVRAALEIYDSADDGDDLEPWMKEEIVRRLEEYEADPSIAIPIDEVRANLARRRAERA